MVDEKNKIKKINRTLHNFKNIVAERKKIINKKNNIQNLINLRKNLRKKVLIPTRNIYKVKKNLQKPKLNIQKSNINTKKLKLILNIQKPKPNNRNPKLNIQNLKQKVQISKQSVQKPKQNVQTSKQKLQRHKPIIEKPKPSVENPKPTVEKPKPKLQNLIKKTKPKRILQKPIQIIQNIKPDKLDSIEIENIINSNDNLFSFIDKVIYINLEERTDRKEILLEQLKFFPEDKIIRFNAIKESPGYFGCTKSHIAVLEMAIENNWSNCLIVEDDMVWSNFNIGYKILENLIKTPYDVISFGSTSVKYNKETYKLNKGKTTTAYLVNNHYYSKLLENFKEGLQKLYDERVYCKYAIDEYWVLLQEIDNWYIVVPSLTIQEAGFSDIENKKVNYERSFI
jgi:glycosyl transferase family 25